MYVCLSQGTSAVWDLVGRSALCARRREQPSTARRSSVPETSTCLVAEKGGAFRSFLENTSEWGKGEKKWGKWGKGPAVIGPLALEGSGA